jgi:hypothetical protein
MADVAKSGTPSLASVLPCAAHKITGLLSGEALGAFDACYIKGSDNKVYKSVGTTTNAAAKVDGYAATTCPSGEAVTLYHGVVVGYGSGLTAGTRLYVSATTSGGKLADAASTGGTGQVGFVIDSTRVFLARSSY